MPLSNRGGGRAFHWLEDDGLEAWIEAWNARPILVGVLQFG